MKISSIPNFEDSYSKKTTNSKENSENKTILRIRMLVNTGGPGMVVKGSICLA